VLSHIEEKKEEVKVEVKPEIAARPMVLRGRTYKVMTPMGEAFMTVNRDENDSPFEVFINIGKGGMHTMADAEAIGRLISLALRTANGNRGDVAWKIVSQLRGIGGASHVGFGKDRVMSLADAVSKVLAEDMAGVTEQQPETLPLNLTVDTDPITPAVVVNDAKTQNASKQHADLCPECGNTSLIAEEGCYKCYNCGYSKC
jgi:ribonucleoside-diphosphate reductase alpha chain